MNRGFTLLELLIVLALATGLGLIALPLPVQHRDRLVLQQAMRRLRLGLIGSVASPLNALGNPAHCTSPTGQGAGDSGPATVPGQRPCP